MTSPMFTLGFSFGTRPSTSGGILFANSRKSKGESVRRVSNLITGLAGIELSQNATETSGCSNAHSALTRLDLARWSAGGVNRRGLLEAELQQRFAGHFYFFSAGEYL